jgi:hypothetical protein
LVNYGGEANRQVVQLTISPIRHITNSIRGSTIQFGRSFASLWEPEAPMRDLMVASALLAALLTAAGCDRNTGSPTGPTATAEQESMTAGTTTPSTPSLSVSPAALITQPVLNSLCPSVPPFVVPFQLAVQGGNQSTSITDITMRFTDRLGVPMPPVTLPAPALTAQFGSALVAARSLRTFPLSFRLGCGPGVPGTLVVIVDTTDGNGVPGSTEISAPVR